jgi:long-chain fatty acid transport protein
MMLLLAGQAHASGFEVGENGPRALGRGGAYVAGVDEPSAVYYNPAALTRIRGPAATLNLNLVESNVTFQRAPFVETPGRDPSSLLYREVEFASVKNEAGFYPAPMIFAAHNFGLERWSFGAGVYGPPAVGRMRYPEMTTVAPGQDPNSRSNRQGGQSYSIIEQDLLLFYPSLSAAHYIPSANLSIGLTLQAAVLMVDYRVGVDGMSGPGSANQNSEERPQLFTPNELNVRGATVTGILGLLWEPTDRIALGLSYRPRFRIRAPGEITVEYPPELRDQNPTIDDPTAYLTTDLPDMVRFGGQYTHRNSAGRELWDVEANVVYEGWSINEGFNVELLGRVTTTGNSINQQLTDLFLPRNYQNTLSFRLGGDFSMLRNEAGNGVVFRAGAFYEQGASPDAYTNLDFVSFDRFGAMAGASYHHGAFAFDVTGGRVWSPDRTVTNGAYELLTPLWVCNDTQGNTQAVVDACAQRTDGPGHPVNNGVYSGVSFNMFSFGVTYGW